jgi:hypothetical protein
MYGMGQTVCVFHIVSQNLEKGVLHGILQLVHFMTYFRRLVDFYSCKLIRATFSARNWGDSCTHECANSSCLSIGDIFPPDLLDSPLLYRYPSAFVRGFSRIGPPEKRSSYA